MTHENVRDMDAQEYAMSGLDTRDQQEAEAAAEAVADDTFSISKGAFVRHIADAYKAGRAAGQGAYSTIKDMNDLKRYAMGLLPDNLDKVSGVGQDCIVGSDGRLWKLLGTSADGGAVWIAASDAEQEASDQGIDPDYEAARADQPQG